MTAPARAPYPASLTLEAPLEVARWRPLVAWILAIPQALIARVLGYVAGVTALISWFAIVVTGRMPEGLAGFIRNVVRWWTRVEAYTLLMRDEYPPFSLSE